LSAVFAPHRKRESQARSTAQPIIKYRSNSPVRYGTCAIACDSYGQPVRQVPERAVAEKKHLCGDIAMYVTALYKELLAIKT